MSVFNIKPDEARLITFEAGSIGCKGFYRLERFPINLSHVR